MKTAFVCLMVIASALAFPEPAEQRDKRGLLASPLIAAPAIAAPVLAHRTIVAPAPVLAHGAVVSPLAAAPVWRAAPVWGAHAPIAHAPLVW